MQDLVSAEDEAVYGPHIMTQRDPGLAAERAQPANSASSASIKHRHVLGSFFFSSLSFQHPA